MSARILLSLSFRATSALRLKFDVCRELKNHMELLPKTAYIQAQSQFSAQLKFLPRYVSPAMYNIATFHRLVICHRPDIRAKKVCTSRWGNLSFVEQLFYKFSFVRTPRKFTPAKLSIRKPGFSSVVVN